MLKVDLGANYSLCSTQVMWQNTAVYKYKIEISTDNSTWTLVVNQQTNSSSKKTFSDAFATFIGRYVRITATGLPSGSWASIYEFRTFAVDLAINKTTLSSSTQSPNMPSNAVDGDTSSRWAANGSGSNEWLMVDLGSISTLSGTNIIWEKTGVYKYKVEISNDNASWTQVVNQTGNSASKHVFTDNFSQKTGRYVRITATGLPSGYWASIREFSVLGPFPDPIKSYHLVFLHSNMVLHNLYGSSNIVQSILNYNNNICQIWQFLPASTPGFYQIQIVFSKWVLNNTNGTINVAMSTGGANQQFKLFPSSKSGYYYIIEKQTGKPIEVIGSSLSDGATLGENNLNSSYPSCANQLVKLEDATPWTLTEFMIGSWVGPNCDVTSLNAYRLANFNAVLDIRGEDDYFTNSNETSTSILNVNSLPRVDHLDYISVQPITYPHPMEYCLKLLKQVGGLKMLVQSGGVVRGTKAINDPFSITNDYCSPGSVTDDQCLSDVNNITVAYKNYSQYRNQMLGYFIADEPDNNSLIVRANLIKKNLSAADPGMLGFINLRPYYDFSSWDDYTTYVENYISDANTKTVSYDYYVFDYGTSSPSGFFPMNNPNGEPCCFFLHLNLFASTIQYYNNLGGKQTMFLGSYGSSSEMMIQSESHSPFPTGQTLRYYASSNAIYGSKGMTWFTYQAMGSPTNDLYIPHAVDNTSAIPPPPPESTTIIRDSITRINGELVKMGPILLGLNWIKTVHGSSIDPCTGEFNLLTGDMSDNIISMTGQMQPYNGPHPSAGQMVDYMAVGEFQPSAGDQSVKYVLIMNKWIKYNGLGLYSGSPTDFYYTAVGVNKKISQFNKSTGAWTQLSTTSGQGTTFDLVVGPGDVQLIRISN